MTSKGKLRAQRFKRGGQKGDHPVASPCLGWNKITVPCQVALDVNRARLEIDIIPGKRSYFAMARPCIKSELPHVSILPTDRKHHFCVLITLKRIRFFSVFVQFRYVLKWLISDEPAPVRETQYLAGK